jgi:hypothetical protein
MGLDFGTLLTAVNPLFGGALQLGGAASDATAPGGAPTAQQLTPEQQAQVSAAFGNPSTQGPVTGYTDPQVTYANVGGVQVPSGVTPPQPIYGASVRDQAMTGFQAGPRDAPQAQAAQMQGAQMQAPANVLGATINTAQMRPGQAVTDRGLGVTAGAVGASTQTRNDQVSQTQRLTSAADGAAPSVAEHQLRSGLAQGMQNNLAMAASARGSGSGAVLAQRQAANNNAALGARTNAQAAQLRAGEMAQARQDLTGHLGTVRQGDVQTGALGTQMAGIGAQMQGIGAQLGTAQAGLNQQANLANQSTQLATGQANLGAAQQTGLANLNAQQQTSLANLNAQMTQQGMDDQQKAMYLGAILGIDARSQQGQQQLQQLLAEMKLRTDATNAGIGLGNAQNDVNWQNGLLSAGGTLGSAAIGA